MKVLLFGATGMVGQGVLRECLQNSEIELIQTVGRTSLKINNPKLHEIIHPDLWNYEGIKESLKNFDACFFCLGVSSSGMSEAEYTHMTYDLTMSAAKILAQINPEMVFIYVSGEGTDSSEKGNSMWARVKGKTENDLMKLFKNSFMFRPGIIEPLNGVVSKTKSYRLFYTLFKPLMPILHLFFSKYVTTTEKVGRAMIIVAKVGFGKKIVSTSDINSII